MSGVENTASTDHIGASAASATPVRAYTITSPSLETGLPHIWSAAQNLKSYSQVGCNLINHLEQTKIPICEEKMGSIAGLFNTMAMYSDGDIGAIVSLNPDHRSNYERLMAHEVFHSFQHVHYNLVRQSPDLNLFETVLRSLLLEAGAETISAVVLYEMKMNGYEKPFDDAKSVLNQQQNYARLYRVYERAALENADDATLQRKHAATRTFNAYLQGEGLVSVYTQGTLSKYLKDIHRGAFQGPPATGYTMRQLKYFCGNLIDEIDLPRTNDDLFAGNTRLRQLAEWTEHTRWKQHEGESDLVQMQRASLERDGNPFLNIDLGDLCARLRLQPGQHVAEVQPVLRIACEMAGLSDIQPPSQRFNQQAVRADRPNPLERGEKPSQNVRDRRGIPF